MDELIARLLEWSRAREEEERKEKEEGSLGTIKDAVIRKSQLPTVKTLHFGCQRRDGTKSSCDTVCRMNVLVEVAIYMFIP